MTVMCVWTYENTYFFSCLGIDKTIEKLFIECWTAIYIQQDV